MSIDQTANQAQVDLAAAFTNTSNPHNERVTVPGDIGGQTLTPGLYTSSSSLAIAKGPLTLDAKGDSQAVFVFQAGSTLITGNNVILANGATPANIFWEVGTSATLGVRHVQGYRHRPDPSRWSQAQPSMAGWCVRTAQSPWTATTSRTPHRNPFNPHN